MTRHRRFRFLAVLLLALVLTSGMVTPTLAESENDMVEVTAQVLPYLEVTISPTSHDFGPVPSVWDPADGDERGYWFEELLGTITVTSNLPYGGHIENYLDYSTWPLLPGKHFLVMVEGPGGRAWYLWEPAALNASHSFWLRLYLLPDAMPIPPGTINGKVLFTVTQAM